MANDAKRWVLLDAEGKRLTTVRAVPEEEVTRRLKAGQTVVEADKWTGEDAVATPEPVEAPEWADDKPLTGRALARILSGLGIAV